MTRAPVCAECRRTMQCLKQDVIWKTSAGHRHYGDLFQCQSCGHRVIVGLGAPLRTDLEWTFEEAKP